MKTSDAYPSRFVEAGNLKGQDLELTIQDVQMAEVGRGGETKPVIFFVGKGKGMVCNKTNWKTISTMHGEESDGWRGKKITIYPTMTTFDNEEVDCIRVRRQMAAPAPQQVADVVQQTVQQATQQQGPMGDPGRQDDLDDEIPF